LSGKGFLPPIDPRDANAATAFGLQARKTGTEREALPLLTRAARLNPSHAALWQVLGLCHRARDDMASALGALAHAATLAPQDALIAHAHARTAMEAGLPATQLFDRALQLAPLDGGIIIGRSAAQMAEGNIAAAIADLDAVLTRNPSWYEGHAALSKLRWLGAEKAQFTVSLERALGFSPLDVNLWSQLVLLTFQARQFAQTLDIILRARRAIGRDEAFLFIEACCLTELNRTDEADRAFTAIGDVDAPMMVEHRVRHALRTGRINEAANLCARFGEGPLTDLLHPYAQIVWRMQGDPRWQQWVERPNLVGIHDISAQLPPQNVMIDVLTALHHASHEPLEQSVRGGSQTDGPLFSRIDPVIQSVRSAVLAAVQTHIKTLPLHDRGLPADYDDVRFAGSWSVLLRGAGHHASHVHQAGWLSSALYIAVPQQQEMGPVPAGWLALGKPPAELGTGLEPTQMIEPKFGRLVLFPSTMWHGTEPIAGGTRLTVAFDIAPPATDATPPTTVA
jgi:tetratricopeptide (TPR) repeat protein